MKVSVCVRACLCEREGKNGARLRKRERERPKLIQIRPPPKDSRKSERIKVHGKNDRLGKNGKKKYLHVVKRRRNW